MRILSSTSTVDWSLVVATGGLLLGAPLLTLRHELWPVFVAVTLLASGGLVVLWYRDVLTTTEILWGAVVLRIAYLPLLPELTDDPYRYLWDGLLQVKGLNPYRYVPAADVLSFLQDGVLFERMNSRSYYSIYPPLSQLVFFVGGLGTQLDWRLGYYFVKLIFVGAELWGLALLSSLASARVLLLYAWNPLVLVEIAGQAHTEALVVLALIGALWAFKNGWKRASSLAVAGAGLVKLYPFLLWPFLFRRYGIQAQWPGALLVVGASLPYSAGYVFPHIQSSAELFVRLFEFNAGPYYLVKHLLWVATGADWSKTIGPAFRMIFLACLPVLYLLDWWREWSLRRAWMVTIGLLFALSTTVHPWYLLPLIALGTVGTEPAWSWIWLGALSIGTYLFYMGGPYWIWIILGWGGATLLGVWRHRASLRPMGHFFQLSRTAD